MPEKKNPRNERESTEERNDNQAAALEESEEQHEESTVVEEADPNLKEHHVMKVRGIFENRSRAEKTTQSRNPLRE